MSVKSIVLGLAAAALAAAAFAVYAPDRVQGFSPAAADYARATRARLGLPPEKAPSPDPQPAAAAPPAVPVRAETAERKDFPVVLESLGQVTPYNTVTVKVRVDGLIDKLHFQEGQIVHAGDLIAEIDPRPFQATLDSAKAKKAQDEATLANAKLDLGRYSTLAKQSYATEQQLDTQKALVNSDTALIAADDAAIDSANVNLGYARITAPLTGKVGFRLVDQGNMVQASQQTGIVVINQLQPITVIFTAPEEQVGEINALMKTGDAKIEVKNTDGAALATGVLEVVNNQIDVATGTVQLKGRFQNDDNKLWPGLAVIVDLTLGVDKNAVVLPTAAVQHGVNGLYVYVIGDDNKVAARPVKIAHQNTQEAALSSGLDGGEKIVTSGQSRLKPGAVVAVQTPEPRS